MNCLRSVAQVCWVIWTDILFRIFLWYSRRSRPYFFLRRGNVLERSSAQIGSSLLKDNIEKITDSWKYLELYYTCFVKYKILKSLFPVVFMDNCFSLDNKCLFLYPLAVVLFYCFEGESILYEYILNNVLLFIFCMSLEHDIWIRHLLAPSSNGRILTSNNQFLYISVTHWWILHDIVPSSQKLSTTSTFVFQLLLSRLGRNSK